MATGDKYLVSTQGSLYGVTCVNVFTYDETASTSDPFPALAVCDAFFEDMVPEWMACVTSAFELHCITAQLITTGPAAPQVLVPTSANVGTRPGLALPANQVVCCSVYTATFTKRGRGRHFFSGIALADERDNAISDEVANLYDLFTDVMSDPINESGGGQWQPVVWSRTANLFPPVIAAEYSPQVRLHRSRTPRLC